MVNRNLIRELDLGDELEQEIDLAMGGSDAADFDVGQAPSLAINSVVEGKILRVDDEFVLVDVGYKSEGHIPRNEWDETEPAPEVGDVIKVLLEDIEENIVDEHRGLITLSKRKARRIEDWLRVMSSVHEDDVVTGILVISNALPNKYNLFLAEDGLVAISTYESSSVHLQIPPEAV